MNDTEIKYRIQRWSNGKFLALANLVNTVPPPYVVNINRMTLTPSCLKGLRCSVNVTDVDEESHNLFKETNL